MFKIILGSKRIERILFNFVQYDLRIDNFETTDIPQLKKKLTQTDANLTT